MRTSSATLERTISPQADRMMTAAVRKRDRPKATSESRDRYHDHEAVRRIAGLDEEITVTTSEVHGIGDEARRPRGIHAIITNDEPVPDHHPTTAGIGMLLVIGTSRDTEILGANNTISVKIHFGVSATGHLTLVRGRGLSIVIDVLITMRGTESDSDVRRPHLAGRKLDPCPRSPLIPWPDLLARLPRPMTKTT
jgi:hypothetical protein